MAIGFLFLDDIGDKFKENRYITPLKKPHNQSMRLHKTIGQIAAAMQQSGRGYKDNKKSHTLEQGAAFKVVQNPT